MEIYGYAGPAGDDFRRVVVEEFHFTPRTDALAFADGDVFDLGGVRIRVLHAPGAHRAATRSSTSSRTTCSTSATSTSRASVPTTATPGPRSRTSSARSPPCATSTARWYATFHHIGVLDGPVAFRERLDRFAAVIADREARLLAYLGSPRTLDEVAAHRFVYRPADPVSFAEPVERRSMGQHIARLVRAGRVREVEPGLYLAAGDPVDCGRPC
jgi:hypothetical protein